MLPQQLYNNYCDAVKDCLSTRVLPRIREKHDEAMLRELVRRWDNHKLFIKFLSHIFKYIDRFYVKRLSLPELVDVGNQEFHNIIFNAVKRDVRSAILEMIRRERESEIIDRTLVKQVVDIFVDMGGSRNSCAQSLPPAAIAPAFFAPRPSALGGSRSRSALPRSSPAAAAMHSAAAAVTARVPPLRLLPSSRTLRAHVGCCYACGGNAAAELLYMLRLPVALTCPAPQYPPRLSGLRCT